MKRAILDGIAEVLAGTVTKLVRNVRERKEEFCPHCKSQVLTRPFDVTWQVPLSDVATLSVPLEFHLCISCGKRFMTRRYMAKLVQRFGAKRIYEWFLITGKKAIK